MLLPSAYNYADTDDLSAVKSQKSVIISKIIKRYIFKENTCSDVI